jgi:hypothetical protein
MGDRLKKRLAALQGGEPLFGVDDSRIQYIIRATREQRFTSPFIHTPEKVKIGKPESGFNMTRLTDYGGEERKYITNAPTRREPDPITSGILEGLTRPVFDIHQELSQAGEEVKQGKIRSYRGISWKW